MISLKPVMAQINIPIIDSTYTGNFLQTNLFNDINLLNLNSIANYTTTFQRFGVSVGNYYLSNVSKLSQNFFSDYNNFRFLLFYNVRENFNAGIGYQNKFYNADRTALNNQNNSNYLFANFDYDLFNNVFLNTKLGVKAEDQIGEYNSGFSGILTAQADNYSFNDYLTNGNLILFYQNLMQKQSHNYEINTNVYKRFSSEASNTGFLRVYNQSNDFYLPATASVVNQFNVKNNIENYSENYVSFGDNLNYSLSSNLSLSLGGIYVNRNIKRQFKYKATSTNVLLENVYDTKILENNLELGAALNYNWNDLLTQLKLAYSERSENHSLLNTTGLTPGQVLEIERAERNKNNNSQRTSLLVDASYFLSNTNSINLTGSASLLRYDTDFQQNFDDRDELETIFAAMHNYNNLLNFNLQTRLEVLVSKLNYIYSQRSANNYTNRIYKLSSLSQYTPVKNLTTQNYFLVLANYTVYDFDDIISEVQSFSYRQLSARDSTTFYLTDRLSIGFIGELKFYEQGQFNNDNFSVRPIAYFVEQLYNPSINYSVNYFMNIGIGYNYFQQQRYQYDESEKRLINTFRSFGPVGKINFYLNKNSIVNFTGGIDYISYDIPPQKNSAVNLQMNIMWNM